MKKEDVYREMFLGKKHMKNKKPVYMPKTVSFKDYELLAVAAKEVIADIRYQRNIAIISAFGFAVGAFLLGGLA